MDDGGERVGRDAIEHEIDLRQAALLVAVEFVVEARVTLGAALHLVEEIDHHFGQRDLVVQFNTLGRQVLELRHVAATALAQLHERAGVLLGRDDAHAEVGLLDVLDVLCRRQVGRIVDLHHFAVGLGDAVLDARRSGDERQAELALETFLHDLHVQQTEESATETESERTRRFGFVRDRCVVELQLLQALAKVLELVAVDRIQTAEHHRLGIAITG